MNFLYIFLFIIGYIGIGYLTAIAVMIFDSPTLQPEESFLVIFL